MIKPASDTLYFSDKLQFKLGGLTHYPLTVVEAPSGFGKTTAVQEYLRRSRPDAVQIWYTCLGEAAVKAWNGICGLFRRIDPDVAGAMRDLEFPTSDTLGDLAALLREVWCEAETYLMIDNYQLVSNDIPRQLMNAFSVHGNPKLHIVFITQQLKDGHQSTVHHANICYIDSDDLLFDRESTDKYFRSTGIRLSESDLSDVYENTEGWVAAIRLQRQSYKETGAFQRTKDIEQLIKTAIWNRLTGTEKDFLLSVSVLDGFTTKQAQIMLDSESIPDSILSLLERNALIRYSPEKDLYIIHAIFQDYLRNLFYNLQTETFQALMLRRAGAACASVGEYYTAAKFYRRNEDFESILSLPINSVYLTSQKERNLMEFLTDIVDTCPDATLRRYPMVIMAFAFQFFKGGLYVPFGKLCGIIGSVLADPGDLPKDILRKITGEFALLTSFKEYNDIQKMSEGHKKALACLDGPSTFFIRAGQWTFMNVSVVNMFWSKTGELENELAAMDECMPIYVKLTEGHGASAEFVMRAEAMLMRGADSEAEALCYKALYIGRSWQQASLCICAELILARIAMLRGDGNNYRMVLGDLRRPADSLHGNVILRMTELCDTALSLTLGGAEKATEWLRDLESINKILETPAIPFGHIIYGKILLREKRYNELFGLSDMMMGMAARLNYLLPQVYHLLYLAIAKNARGMTEEARADLIKALSIALPDKVYLPFAEQGAELLPLLEAVRLTVDNREGVNAVIALLKRQESGMDAIRKALATAKSPLTKREREIALLAKERLAAKEIAEKLFISENTVRTVLKTIYDKLDIHSKAELANVEF
ncbi:MAG: LuxR C-terminal-related transcriptional regulator [Clostridiales bacterium]|jgi:LuxR family maltose regulon positive regulatory protein|nr:LuxR C-terminal-related transcriptional regulator [Clostridiales bacterium]